MRITLSSARAVRPGRPARSRTARSGWSARSKVDRRNAGRSTRRRGTPMTSRFDFAPLFPPGLPAPTARWTGLAKYSFVGGNNDSEQLPLDGLVEAVNTVLKREGRNLATYGLAHGPQGYLPLREFLVTKLKR